MKKVNVYPKINHGEYPNRPDGEIVGFTVDEGRVDGKRKRTFFKTREEADTYSSLVNVQREAKQYEALGDLREVMGIRYEVLSCHHKLQSVGATFTQAVDFYLQHAKSSKGNITVGEATTAFLKAKTNKGCSTRYLDSLRNVHYPRFYSDFPTSRVMNEITHEQIYTHVYKHANWNPTTKINYLRNLNALFNWCISQGYFTINPVERVERPQKDGTDIKILKIGDVKKLLNTALKYRMYDRLAINVLVLFCGIRIEEACKLMWSDIDYNTWTVTVSPRIAKLRQRRINNLPDNAKLWLRLGRPPRSADRKKTFIIGGDFESKLTWLRKKAKIEYPKNAARHSFASYHVALNGNAAQTAIMMGHIGDANTLYNHYRNAVSQKDAVRYFEIKPNPKQMKDHQTRVGHEV